MTIRIEEIGPAVIATEYAVRGAIVARAQELERQGREITYCNIGNPQSLGQKPLKRKPLKISNLVLLDTKIELQCLKPHRHVVL